MTFVVHYELVEHGRIIIVDAIYLQLDRVNEVLHRKCPAFVKRKLVFLLHGMTLLNVDILSYRPYLPDLMFFICSIHFNIQK